MRPERNGLGAAGGFGSGPPLSTSGRRWREALGARLDPAARRIRRALRQEELRGLAFAFKARSLAAAAVAAWLVVIVPVPRLFYFLAVVGLLFLLGLVPHLLRRKPYAEAARFGFIALDVLLITAVILIPFPLDDAGWPIQMRLRFVDYLYLLLYLVESALSYSPLTVIWTGLCTVTIWSVGFLTIYARPDTVTWAARIGQRGPVPPSESLAVVLDPFYVSLTTLWNQIALTVIVTALLAAAVWRARRTLERQTAAEVTRADLARYVSPDVADALTTGPRGTFGAPATRHVTVLFADIVGFTTLAETLPPERVVALLRSFHARTCRIVFRHGGTLDKFLGDGFMATFGTLADDRDSARKALACAFDLQEEMERWGAKRASRSEPTLAVAVGVHYGPVVVGNVGAEQRLEFTVIGDTVNVASRLERLTREHACRIALSREALDAAGGPNVLGHPFEARGRIVLRGRQEPVELYTWPASAAH
jgi:adenylate cyclase